MSRSGGFYVSVVIVTSKTVERLETMVYFG